jgi:hypothetical protein
MLAMGLFGLDELGHYLIGSRMLVEGQPDQTLEVLGHTP